MRVYLGGKIHKSDWRHTLFPDLRGAVYGNTFAEMQLETRGVDHLIRNGLLYSGPFFMGCDHGCYHFRESHALGAAWEWEERDGCESNSQITRAEAVELCTEWLSNSDVMVVWAGDDFHTAHGTHIEMGYAKAMGLPVYLMIDRTLDNEYIRSWWFAAEAADKRIFVDDPISGFDQVEGWL